MNNRKANLTWIDVGLITVYFVISIIALRLMGFSWWWTIPLAMFITLVAWSIGYMGAPR